MKNIFCILTSVFMLSFIGCKPYHEQVRVPIKTSEVAILVETINENKQQTVAPKGKSSEDHQIEYYKKRVVNARMVDIPYYWKQTGRVWFYQNNTNGKWTPAARLIVVDTAPETRRWDSEKSRGGAIWVESSDSVGFSTGISLTARIANRDDAILFLSNYPPENTRDVVVRKEKFNVEVTSLQQIMDDEIHTKVQELYAEQAAKWKMDELREKKVEILNLVEQGWEREDGSSVVGVLEFFKERGITITSIGQFGGFTYENPQIQESIDKVFQAQQDEEVAVAEYAAAEKRKLALKSEGEGEGDKILQRKIKEAEGIRAIAEAKAYEIEQAKKDLETYLELKRLEVEMAKLDKWDGVYPKTVMGESANMLFQMPVTYEEKNND